MLGRGGRAAAALVAAVGWWAVLREVWLVAGSSSVTALLWTSWRLADYFTNIANLATAAIFTGLAIGHRRAASHRLIGSAMLSMILVGAVYNLMLRGHRAHLNAARLFNDDLLHIVMPLAVPLFWLLFVRKGVFRRTEPFAWSILPTGYLAYALVRGAVTQHYPYPFINVDRIGWSQTAINAALIAAAFVLVGYLILWIDRRLAGGSRGGAPARRTGRRRRAG